MQALNKIVTVARYIILPTFSENMDETMMTIKVNLDVGNSEKEMTLHLSCDENLRDERLFKPFYLISQWCELLTSSSCDTIALLLTSCIATDVYGRSMYRLELIQQCSTPEIQKVRPSEKSDVQKLHSLWLVLQKW